MEKEIIEKIEEIRKIQNEMELRDVRGSDKANDFSIVLAKILVKLEKQELRIKKLEEVIRYG